MPDHKTITDPEIHEPKGVASAADDEFLVASGGSALWRSFPSFNLILSGSELTTQSPTGLDAPLQLKYGPAQTTTDVSLSVAGDITFNTGGLYRLMFQTHLGRTGGTGASILLGRGRLNGVQVGDAEITKLDNSDVLITINNQIELNVNPGDVFTAQLIRENTGNDSGDAVTFTPSGPNASTWGQIPSTQVTIWKRDI